MKRHMTLLGALAAAICFAQTAAAQELVRVYAPETIPYIGTTTNYGYGVTPVYRSSNYAPATTTYYAPEVAVPTTTYYAPAVVPTTTYYAPYHDLLCTDCRRGALHELLRCRPGLYELLRAALLWPCVLLWSGAVRSGSAHTQFVPRHDVVTCRVHRKQLKRKSKPRGR